MPKTVTCVDINGKTYQVPISELSWRPSAYGIVVKDGQILLSPQFHGKYDLPGGGIELGELPEEAVIREVKEETGLDVANPQLVGCASSFFKFAHDDDSQVQSLMLYFVCEISRGNLTTDGFDDGEKKYAELAKWIDVSKLDTIELASSVDFRPHIYGVVGK